VKKNKNISIKTEKEIEIMKEGGRILAWVMAEIIKAVKPGVKTIELDHLAEQLIKKNGGQSSFKTVPKYYWTTCLCVNDCIVHGIPNQYQLKENDLLTIDVGNFYQGFHTDMARTLCVRTQNSKLKTQNSKEIDRFLETGKMALRKAIEQAKIGNRIGHISKAIDETIEGAGYSVVKTLVGHGVGRKLHEPPQIPCFLKGKIEETPVLKRGVTLAVEVIYNQGTDQVFIKKNDRWSVFTKDGKLSGLFENTIAITSQGPIVLTELD